MRTVTSAKANAALLVCLLLPALAFAAQPAAQPTVHPSAQPDRPLTREGAEDRLRAAGYRDVERLVFDNDMWRARARAADGVRLDISIDPATGLLYPELPVAMLAGTAKIVRSTRD